MWICDDGDYWFWDWMNKEEIWNGSEDGLDFEGKDFVMDIHLYNPGWMRDKESNCEKGSGQGIEIFNGDFMVLSEQMR